MSVIRTTQEMQFTEKYTHTWSEHGLIRGLNYCRTLMKVKEFKPHDPTTFTLVEIYTNHFSTTMSHNKISSQYGGVYFEVQHLLSPAWKKLSWRCAYTESPVLIEISDCLPKGEGRSVAVVHRRP